MKKKSEPPTKSPSRMVSPKNQDRYLADPHLVGVGTRFPAVGEPEWTVDIRVNGRVRPVGIGECGKVKRATAGQLSQQLCSFGVGTFSGSLTLRSVAVQFLADRKPAWKERTQKSNRHAVKRFGELLDLPILQIDRQRVALWRDKTRCNRTLAILSGVLRYARDNELIPRTQNPCSGLRKKERQFKAHYLTEAEYQRLGEVLRDEMTHRAAPASATLLLALTGARKSEILELQWKHIGDQGIQLQDSKSGPRFIGLNAGARWVIDHLPKGTPEQAVIRRRCGAALPESSLSRFWQQVRQKIGLPERARLHDLRHGFASAGLNFGTDISLIGALLGHRDPASTLAYAHLTSSAVRNDGERSARHLQAQLSRKKSGPKKS